MRRKQKSNLKWQATKTFEDTHAALYDDSRYVVSVGGSRSGKTYGLLQLMFLYALQNPESIIVIARRYYSTLRKTIIKQDLPPFLREFQYKCKFNKTDNIIVFNNGSIIQFVGLDDESSLRGLQSDIAWINEATEITLDSFTQIDMRATRKVIVDYNPSRMNFFIDDLPDERKTIIHSTYVNNPFLTDEQIRTIVQLKQFDEGLYNIFCLGIPATSREHVYQAFEQCERPDYFNENDFIYAMDIGYNTTCLMKIYYHKDEVWMEEVLYEKHMAISEFILKMKQVGVFNNKLIIADAAARLSIEEIRKSGYQVQSSDKGVAQGILITKSFKLMCSPDSSNLIREVFEYKFKRVNGDLTDVPQKSETIHLMDAMQYGLVYIHKYLRNGTGRKSLLF